MGLFYFQTCSIITARMPIGGVYETSPPFIHLECDDLMGFLTRKRDKQVFTTDTTSGKEYRKDYDFQAKSKDPQPNFGTRAQTSQDIKKITDSATDRDTQQYDFKTSKKNYKKYRGNTKNKMDKQFKRQDRKARKRQHRAEKKRDKQQQKKSEIDKQLKDAKQEVSKEYHEDQQSEVEDREIARQIDGRDGDLR